MVGAASGKDADRDRLRISVIAVGVLMLAYVLFGGMVATTWVQIIKAVLLVGGATLMTVWVLSKYGFNPLRLFYEALERPPAARRSSARATRWSPAAGTPPCSAWP